MISTVAGISRGVRPRRLALSAGASVLSGVSRVSWTRTSGSRVCANAEQAATASAAASGSRLVRRQVALSFTFSPWAGRLPGPASRHKKGPGRGPFSSGRICNSLDRKTRLLVRVLVEVRAFLVADAVSIGLSRRGQRDLSQGPALRPVAERIDIRRHLVAGLDDGPGPARSNQVAGARQFDHPQPRL